MGLRETFGTGFWNPNCTVVGPPGSGHGSLVTRWGVDVGPNTANASGKIGAMEMFGKLWPDYPATGKDTRDSRDLCFSQGKPCVYINDEDTHIITEWPNGVVDELLLADESTTRKWPNGRVDHFAPGDPDGNSFPHIKTAVALGR